MKCENAKPLISLHIDNKLSLEEVKELMEHLNTCESCRQTYKDFKDIKIVLSDMQKTKLSDNFTDSVMLKIKEAKNKRNKQNIIFISFLKRHFVMAASFIFIIAASAVILSNKPSSSSNTTALAEYYLNYEQNTSVEEIYDENIVSFLLLY